MPPHLHPRSRLTSSLFATTVFASFVVVAIPHILPCPAPRVVYADGEVPDGATPRRRRRRKCLDDGGAVALKDSAVVDEESDDFEAALGENMKDRKPKRECPVPKPTGLVAEILGFKKVSGRKEGTESSKPP